LSGPLLAAFFTPVDFFLAVFFAAVAPLLRRFLYPGRPLLGGLLRSGVRFWAVCFAAVDRCLVPLDRLDCAFGAGRRRSDPFSHRCGLAPGLTRERRCDTRGRSQSFTDEHGRAIKSLRRHWSIFPLGVTV
jgi:hypothetical protein